jgi:hypothetical protein
MTEQQQQPVEAGATMDQAEKLPLLATIERLAGWQLGNRFVWLVYAAVLYLLLALSFVQWQSSIQGMKPRFDTLVLASNLMLVKEAGLITLALLFISSLPAIRNRWKATHKAQAFSTPLYAISMLLAIILVDALWLAPTIALHSYPQLAQEGYLIPLMLLQRDAIQLSVLFICVNIAFIAVAYLRLPFHLAGLLALCAHVGLGLLLTYTSVTHDWASRLNDVFYYNQLWQYIDGFPNWQRPQVFTNMQSAVQPYFLYYLCIGYGLWLFTFLLWLPRTFHISRSS